MGLHFPSAPPNPTITLPMVDPLNAALDQSVMDHPKAQQGTIRFGWDSVRGPILPKWGSRERERELRLYYHHDYNTLFRGATAGLVKRVQSTPWEVKSDLSDGDRWQQVLMQADFGDWDRFLSKLIVDYLRHDQGGFIELIAPGDPREAPIGAITGMAVLDSVRCYPTGDPTYPVIYYDLYNRMHIMHRARVMQIVDTPDSDEHSFGIGECALSRCIAPIYRQILMGRYIEQFLDDDPPPGIILWGNLNDKNVEAKLQGMKDRRGLDQRDAWGRTVHFYGLDTAVKPSVEVVQFNKTPEGFDFEKYTALDVKEIALGIGLDIQDIWELSGGSIGSGAQSQILAQKSRGKALGRILKGLERVINEALPPHVEFAFKYEDPQADMEQAQIMQAMAGAVQTVATYLSPDEVRQFLANTNPALRDILTNPDGSIRRLGDADPKSGQQIAQDAATLVETPEGGLALNDTSSAHAGSQGLTLAAASDASKLVLTAPPSALSLKAQKALTETFAAFASRFIPAVRMAAGGTLNQATLRALLRDQLADSGLLAYEDGLEDGGAVVTDATTEEKAQWRRKVAEWLSAQNPYIEQFVESIAGTETSETEIARRADLWATKSLQTIYYAGLADADSLSNYQWMLGATEQHCQTCLALNGQVHRLKDWIESGYLPGSSSLECGGYQCDCRLSKTRARAFGRLPGGAGSAPSLRDRLLGWLRGLIGRGG